MYTKCTYSWNNLGVTNKYICEISTISLWYIHMGTLILKGKRLTKINRQNICYIISGNFSQTGFSCLKYKSWKFKAHNYSSLQNTFKLLYTLYNSWYSVYINVFCINISPLQCRDRQREAQFRNSTFPPQIRTSHSSKRKKNQKHFEKLFPKKLYE